MDSMCRESVLEGSTYGLLHAFRNLSEIVRTMLAYRSSLMHWPFLVITVRPLSATHMLCGHRPIGVLHTPSPPGPQAGPAVQSSPFLMPSRRQLDSSRRVWPGPSVSCELRKFRQGKLRVPIMANGFCSRLSMFQARPRKGCVF